MVAISGDDVPATTPVSDAQRTWKSTAILLLLGFLTFVSVSVFIIPGPGEVNEGRDFHHEPEAPPQPGPPAGSRMLMGVGR
jgi:hypothetical protein